MGTVLGLSHRLNNEITDRKPMNRTGRITSVKYFHTGHTAIVRLYGEQACSKTISIHLGPSDEETLY